MFQTKEKGSIRYIEGAALAACGMVTHAFLTRQGGVSEGKFSSLNFSIREGDGQGSVERNWDILSAAFGLPRSSFFTMRQVHGDRIVLVEDLDQGPEAPVECDALITALPGVVVGIKTADCVPILLADGVRRVVGAVHAGWRGTSLGIAAKAVRVLGERFSSHPEDITAAIGPSIGRCCYQVDEQVFLARDGDPDWRRAFRGCEEPGRWMLDLPLANRIQLEKAGVPQGNITSAGFCTACRTDLFFSHRAEKGGTGRQLSFIGIS